MENTNEKWYKKEWFLWLMLVLMPYFGIPLIWGLKKDWTKNKKITLSVVFVLWFLFALGSSPSEEENIIENSQSVVIQPEVIPEPTVAEKEEVVVEDEPTFEYENDFEFSIGTCIISGGGEVIGISISSNDDGSEYLSVYAYVKNNETTINNLLDYTKKLAQDNEFDKEICFFLFDVQEHSLSSSLITISIEVDGTYTTHSVTDNYKSERNEWITSQFKGWNGENIYLGDIIKASMNDSKSYEHISTEYVDISNNTILDEVNKALETDGYTVKADLNDLFIITTFSGKNVFNATVKNTAFAIARYETKDMYLIDIVS